jgi:glycosyltransferase involved in cell wall biosynthesis
MMSSSSDPIDRTSDSGPLLTVVLLCRERTDFLAEAIDSLRNQAPDARVAVTIYDSSKTDAVRQVLEKLEVPPHKYVSTGQSNIANDNWVQALCSVDTPYVLCLHDDDIILPGGLQRLLAGLDKFPDADIVYSPAWSFGASAKPLFHGPFHPAPGVLSTDRTTRLNDMLGHKLMTTVIGCAIKTERLRSLRVPAESNPIYDLFFNAAVALSSWKVCYITEPVGSWRISDKQQSHTWNTWAAETVAIYRAAQNVVPATKVPTSAVSKRLNILRLRLVRIGVLRRDPSVIPSLYPKKSLVKALETALREVS